MIETKPQQIGSVLKIEIEREKECEGEKINKWFCECQRWHWHRIKAFLICYLPEISISYLFAHQNLRMALIFPYEIPLYIIRWHVSDFLYPTHTHTHTSSRVHTRTRHQIAVSNLNRSTIAACSCVNRRKKNKCGIGNSSK